MDYELFRLNPAGHYGTNILLHLINVLLLLICLQKLTGRFWHSLMVSALFAVHPLNVESVAWVAERKNLLSTTFWLLTMLCYARYVKKPSPVRYLLLTIVFIGGLLTKPMLVTLPFVLLLLDVWPLRRTDFKRIPWGLLTEKSPLIVLSIISVIMTIAAAHSVGTIAEMNAITLTDRIQNAFLSYAIYIYKMFWPFDLAVFYPYPKVFNPLIVALAAFFLLMISAMAWRLRRAQPYLLLGWLWFLGTLLPVIGLIQVGQQALADRYTYVPMIGLFIMLVWGIPALFKEWALSVNLKAVSALILLALSFLTWRQVQIWESNSSLFQHTLMVTVENQKGHHGLGMAYYSKGETDRALRHLKESLRIKQDETIHNDLGNVYMAAKNYQEAEGHFRTALQYNAKSAKAHNNMGAALASQGRSEEAIVHFRAALKLDPNYNAALYNLTTAINEKK
ncbi:MAG TPA: tetratricopeptide repeat protein [Smithellaceae bacterium]|nr:tetratricopeptide repeat protein [Smithellaceae bacterium]